MSVTQTGGRGACAGLSVIQRGGACAGLSVLSFSGHDAGTQDSQLVVGEAVGGGAALLAEVYHWALPILSSLSASCTT